LGKKKTNYHSYHENRKSEGRAAKKSKRKNVDWRRGRGENSRPIRKKGLD